MNNLFWGTLLGFSVSTILGFTYMNYEPKKSTSEVDQMQGLYIFTDSHPVLEYEYLGTVKVTVGMDTQYQGVRNKLIDKARKDYPNADALIMQFKSGGTDRCDAIKFK